MIKENISTDGQFYFTVMAGNNQVLLTSETYKTPQGMRKGIKSAVKVFALINSGQGLPILKLPS